MEDSFHAKYRYDGLEIVCSPSELARLHELVRTAAGIPEPSNATVRHIKIRIDCPEPAQPVRWWSAVALALACGINALLLLAGLIQVVEWLSA